MKTDVDERPACRVVAFFNNPASTFSPMVNSMQRSTGVRYEIRKDRNLWVRAEMQKSDRSRT